MCQGRVLESGPVKAGDGGEAEKGEERGRKRVEKARAARCGSWRGSRVDERGKTSSCVQARRNGKAEFETVALRRAAPQNDAVGSMSKRQSSATEQRKERERERERATTRSMPRCCKCETQPSAMNEALSSLSRLAGALLAGAL